MERIKSIKKRNYKGKVYDIEVKDEHNYTIENCVVHNSAAGSLVLYSLGITTLDPIKYELLFERFVSAERTPDIVINYYIKDNI